MPNNDEELRKQTAFLKAISHSLSFIVAILIFLAVSAFFGFI